MLAPIRFLWNATRGHRLAPWRSEYLKWRIETYSGKKADSLRRERCFWVRLGVALGAAGFSGVDGAAGAGRSAESRTATDLLEQERTWLTTDHFRS